VNEKGSQVKRKAQERHCVAKLETTKSEPESSRIIEIFNDFGVEEKNTRR